jgi:hypothetical protein
MGIFSLAGRRAKHVASGPPPFIQYVRATIQPTPGAMIYGYESEWMALRPAIGPAIGAMRQFCSVFPTPGAFQVAAMTWQSGLAGVVHGQSALQPLSNPYGGT